MEANKDFTLQFRDLIVHLAHLLVAEPFQMGPLPNP